MYVPSFMKICRLKRYWREAYTYTDMEKKLTENFSIFRVLVRFARHPKLWKPREMLRRRVVLCGVLLPIAVTFVVFQVQWRSKPVAENAAAERLQDAGTLRVVHLDLKGAPPKIRVLKALFPLIAAAGANALLLEYEDMFPFQGMLRNASAKNAYSREEVR
jgi:hypothetical protein